MAHPPASTCNLLSASVPHISALPRRACPQTCRPIAVEQCCCEVVIRALTCSGQMPTIECELRACCGTMHGLPTPRTPHIDVRSLGRSFPIQQTCARTLLALPDLRRVAFPTCHTRRGAKEYPFCNVERVDNPGAYAKSTGWLRTWVGNRKACAILEPKVATSE